jgi:alkylation response protein AidB-like acyl-CoA dehydrogenase
MAAGLDKETLDLTLEAFRDFARDKLPDELLLELDAKDEFPIALVRELCGEGAFDVYRVCEEMGRVDLGVATGVLATFLGSDPIHFGGTPEQKKRWMTRIAEEGLLMAYCATEPEAGSDLGALRSTAERVEEDGKVVGYRIDGSKQWISNGGFADLYSVLAIAPDGPTWFIVERETEGLSHGQPEDKHGIRASNTAAVSFSNLYVDADALVGGVEGEGLTQAQAVFGYTRLMVAAFGWRPLAWVEVGRRSTWRFPTPPSGSRPGDRCRRNRVTPTS